MTASIPPGWYDDPSAPGMERWWDGAQWTESSRPRTDSGPGVPPGPGHPADQMPPGPGYPADQMPGGLSAPSHTPPYPQYGPYGPGGPGPNNRNRNILIGVVSLLVVGGIVAALIVLLGGGDDGASVATEGRATDPTSGVSIPLMKGWQHDSKRPTLQATGRYPCPDESGGASDEPSDSPSDMPSADASAGSGVDLSGCYLGQIVVGGHEADTFEEAIQKVRDDDLNDKDMKVTKTLKDEDITVDGKKAHLLRVEAEDAKPAADGSKHKGTLQAVVIDSKVEEDGSTGYPVVYVAIDDASNAPPKGVLDTVIDGIKVGQPQPSASAS
ncbi:MAG: DUF2510 domain-containing protein [Streptomycetaceae bacterium]|nr:DUF2510 domain-containing protein [Streptomycetaceae bacterium]